MGEGDRERERVTSVYKHTLKTSKKKLTEACLHEKRTH